jgi:hypothetical protein
MVEGEMVSRVCVADILSGKRRMEDRLVIMDQTLDSEPKTLFLPSRKRRVET